MQENGTPYYTHPYECPPAAVRARESLPDATNRSISAVFTVAGV
jgi:hypothetical protein